MTSEQCAIKVNKYDAILRSSCHYNFLKSVSRLFKMSRRFSSISQKRARCDTKQTGKTCSSLSTTANFTMFPSFLFPRFLLPERTVLLGQCASSGIVSLRTQFCSMVREHEGSIFGALVYLGERYCRTCLLACCCCNATRLCTYVSFVFSDQVAQLFSRVTAA